MTDREPHRVSFEFFPPRSQEAVEKLYATSTRLARLKPDYFSVTFGAGGSTRDRTLETVLEVRARTGIDTAPHLSFIVMPTTEIRVILERYAAHDIRHLVALRGDLPSGVVGMGELRHGSELVTFVRRETGTRFRIEVAAYPEMHPQALSFERDLDNFRRKIDAGADGAITQYFFNPDAYFRFVDEARKRGVTVPIVPGIMPITSCTQLVRFSEACGAEIPRWILYRLRDFGDDRGAIRAFGIDVAIGLCRRLIEQGAPGLHVYTMNQFEAPEAIVNGLALARAAG